MSATAQEVAAVKAARDDYTTALATRGHAMRRQLGENAGRRGHAYFWNGECAHCGATMSIGSCWSSCSGVRDARDVPCSGPATAVLTEIEQAHVSRLLDLAVDQFLWEITE